MTDRYVVNSAARLAEVIRRITQAFKDHKYAIVSIRIGKDRTEKQNALWFGMYKRIAESTEIGDEEDARKYCKLHFGVPIMRKACVDFFNAWNRSFLCLTYEEKLHLMGPCALFGPDGFPVTRLFDRKQGIEYTNKVVDAFKAKGVYFDDLLSEGDDA